MIANKAPRNPNRTFLFMTKEPGYLIFIYDQRARLINLPLYLIHVLYLLSTQFWHKAVPSHLWEWGKTWTLPVCRLHQHYPILEGGAPAGEGRVSKAPVVLTANYK